jgi:putative ABC transport system permease protein
VTVTNVRSGEEYSMLGLLPQRIGASVTASLGLVGLLLAAIGVYGVAAHAVTRRTREIGIRLALGAPYAAVTRLILGEGLTLVALGTAIGLPLAWGAAQLVGGYLAGLPPSDPITFSAATALFAAMGLVACLAPLARALRISAADILRAE